MPSPVIHEVLARFRSRLLPASAVGTRSPLSVLALLTPRVLGIAPILIIRRRELGSRLYRAACSAFLLAVTGKETRAMTRFSVRFWRHLGRKRAIPWKVCPCERSKEDQRCLIVGSCCLFGCVPPAEGISKLLLLYVALVPAALRVIADAFVKSSFSYLRVGAVLCWRRDPEVASPIVELVAVDMIDALGRRHIQEEPVHQEFNILALDPKRSTSITMASHMPIVSRKMLNVFGVNAALLASGKSNEGFHKAMIAGNFIYA